MNDRDTIEEKIAGHRARLAVIGLGYVGLPLALAFVEEGFSVVGLEKDEEKAARLNRGESYIDDIPSSRLAQAVESGFHATLEEGEALEGADAILICVPTPLKVTKDPDISYILEASQAASRHLGRALVVLESTTYPGTTEEVVLPILAEGGRTVGLDFFLAFSPERVDPGNKDYGVHNTPKVVGGVTARCTELAVLLYGMVAEQVVPVSSPRVAEMSKLLENTYRVVNISLVNELAQLCQRMRIDLWEVIRAASTKPYGFTPFYPGPGMGGHCIPIDPFYLSWKAKAYDFDLRFVELAGQINDSMPYFVLDLVAEALNNQSKPVRGSRILVLGVAYKQDIADVRESPALKILPMLAERGATVEYCDPLVPSIKLQDGVLVSTPFTLEKVAEADCVLLLTAHRAFPFAEIAACSRLVVDTRNAFAGIAGEQIVRL
ncbi:MAG: nucleotide sugar dehydrogenase [Coprothermobacterota bacterium]|nr:nucleotide sugar dehydrogenase [Coprothermobacterota bacterium]